MWQAPAPLCISLRKHVRDESHGEPWPGFCSCEGLHTEVQSGITHGATGILLCSLCFCKSCSKGGFFFLQQLAPGFDGSSDKAMLPLAPTTPQHTWASVRQLLHPLSRHFLDSVAFLPVQVHSSAVAIDSFGKEFKESSKSAVASPKQLRLYPYLQL